MGYKHLNIVEREMILFYLAQGLSRCQIAKLLGLHCPSDSQLAQVRADLRTIRTSPLT